MSLPSVSGGSVAVGSGGTTTSPPAGVAVPRAQGDRDGLSAFEMFLLVAFAPMDKMGGPGPDLQMLVMLRGPAPRFDTHEAAMYAMALGALAADYGVDGSADVEVGLDGAETMEAALDRKRPWDRFSLSATAEPGKRKTLTVRGDSDSNVFCRVVVRRAD